MGTKLLIDEYPLMVLPSLAEAIGLNEAILLQQIHYWLHKSGKIRDGREWIFNKHEEFIEQFPFWSERTFKRVVSSLVKKKLIIVGHYNKNKWDRTNWYTIDRDELDRISAKAKKDSAKLSPRESEPKNKNKSGTIDKDRLSPSDEDRLSPSLYTETTQRLQENTSSVATKVDDENSKQIEKENTKSFKDAMAVAEYLANRLSGSIENYKMPSEAGMKKWARDIDRAIRIDNRTKEQLLDVIDWIHDGEGSFWIANIKSGKKLRDQFDTFTAQRTVREKPVDIRTRAVEAFGIGKVFMHAQDTSTGKPVNICLFGDYPNLYYYNRNKFVEKDTAAKLWKYIEQNFDKIVAQSKEL